MKAVVLKTKNNKAAVLLKDGTMRYVENLGYEQGSVLELPDTESGTEAVFEPVRKKHYFRLPGRFAYSAAACFATLMLSTAMVSYACPVSTVPLSPESSVTLGVNLYGRVVDINSRDENDEELIKDIKGDLAGKKTEYVAEKIRAALDEKIIPSEKPAEETDETSGQPVPEQPAEEIVPEEIPSYEAPAEEPSSTENAPAEEDRDDYAKEEDRDKDPKEENSDRNVKDEDNKEIKEKKEPKNPDGIQPAPDTQGEAPQVLSPAPDNNGENPPVDNSNPPNNIGENPPVDNSNPPDNISESPADNENPPDDGNPPDDRDHGGNDGDNPPGGGDRGGSADRPDNGGGRGGGPGGDGPGRR